MALSWTESFIAFKRYDAVPSAAESDACRADLAAAGYRTQAGSTTNFRMGVVSDPVNPARAGFRFNRPVTIGGNLVGGVLARMLPISTDDIFIGFSLFIPASYAPNTTSAQGIFRCMVLPETAPGADITNTDHFVSLHEAFGINSSLQVVAHNVAQSEMKPQQGAINYFEIRIRGNAVSVWMNDALVIQKTLREQPQVVAWMASNYATTTPYPDDWIVSNIYILTADDVAPNTRLGPTTRVIGRKPNADVAVDFTRPSGAPSNASVAAQDVSATPAQSLQTTDVGAKDTYSILSDGDTAGATLVHAVVTKAIAANFEADPHTLRAFVASAGDEGSEAGAKTMRAALPAGVFGTNQITAIGRHPTKGLVAVTTGLGMYHSGDNGATWTVIAAGSGTTHYYDIHFDPITGNGLAVRSDGQIAYCHDSSPITSWTAIASGVTVPLVACWGNNGTFMAVSTTSAATNTRRITYPVDTTPTVASAGAPTTANNDVTWGNGYWMIKTLATAAVHRSPDGATWTTFTPTGLPNTTTGKLVAHVGGDNWVIGGDANTGAVTSFSAWVSSDNGATWSAGNPITGTNLGVFALTVIDGMIYMPGYASLVTGTGGLATADEGPTIFVSKDNGINFTVLPFFEYERSGINKASYAFTAAWDNGLGDVVSGGYNGRMRSMLAASPDKQLPVLGGYTMAYGIASVDPATGLPWVPADAAIANLGMVVSS